jgi:hypothetical protein
MDEAELCQTMEVLCMRSPCCHSRLAFDVSLEEDPHKSWTLDLVVVCFPTEGLQSRSSDLVAWAKRDFPLSIKECELRVAVIMTSSYLSTTTAPAIQPTTHATHSVPVMLRHHQPLT